MMRLLLLLTLQVGILALDIFLVVFDTYFLRMRHYVAEKFYPDRVRPRAVWLFNHILRRRGPMLKVLYFNVWQNSKTTFSSTVYDVIIARSTDSIEPVPNLFIYENRSYIYPSIYPE